MKTISAAVLMALLSVTDARFLNADNVVVSADDAYGNSAYSTSLNCGQCIGLGYHYCISGKDEDY
jgi:hypothetical protein